MFRWTTSELWIVLGEKFYEDFPFGFGQTAWITRHPKFLPKLLTIVQLKIQHLAFSRRPLRSKRRAENRRNGRKDFSKFHFFTVMETLKQGSRFQYRLNLPSEML